MIKKLKMILLSGIIAFTLISPVNAQETNTFLQENIQIEENMSSIILYENDDKMIVASVPVDEEANYRNDLQNDSFYLNEISTANTLPNKRALPPGKIMSQKYMYKSSIQRVVDSYSGNGTFVKLLSNPITDTLIAQLLTKAGYSSVVTFAAAAIAWAAADLYGRQSSWWTDSLIMILKGQISCVRVTHIQNTVSTYPAAYLIIERI